MIVRVRDGAELGSAVYQYPDGVIDERLPSSGERLPPEWALQNPDDYIGVFKQAVPAALKASGIDPADVIGVGIDFTSCTMMPTLADGTPLCRVPQWRDNPHAWVSWEITSSSPADKINETARQMGESWLGATAARFRLSGSSARRCKSSTKRRQRRRPLIEAADWVIWQLWAETHVHDGLQGLYQDGKFPTEVLRSAAS